MESTRTELSLREICARVKLENRMPYPESFIGPMREELTRLGVKELRTAEDVDAAVRGTAGTLMVVVNSMCGCAAGRARPGVALALQHHVTPDVVATVFAGGDIEATERARSYFAPLSPLVAVDRAPSRRADGVHARAASDREPERRSHRARPDGGVRQVLRPGRALGPRRRVYLYSHCSGMVQDGNFASAVLPV